MKYQQSLSEYYLFTTKSKGTVTHKKPCDCLDFPAFIVKSGNSNAMCLSRLVLQNLRNSRNYTLELSCFFFSFPQYTFTSHSSSSNQAFYSELPENICGFHAAPGAPGIQLSEVCSLHWDCLETAQGPWNSPTFMPLNQSKPPLSFLHYPAFAFFSLCSSLLPWVNGVRQTCCAQVCAFVQACLCASVQMNACVGVQQHLRMCISFGVCMYVSVFLMYTCS